MSIMMDKQAPTHTKLSMSQSISMIKRKCMTASWSPLVAIAARYSNASAAAGGKLWSAEQKHRWQHTEGAPSSLQESIVSRPVLHWSYLSGVRGSGHGLVVRPKGYVVESHFPKGRKANRGLRWRVRDYLVNDRRLVQVQTRVEQRIGQR